MKLRFDIVGIYGVNIIATVESKITQVLLLISLLKITMTTNDINRLNRYQ